MWAVILLWLHWGEHQDEANLILGDPWSAGINKPRQVLTFHMWKKKSLKNLVIPLSLPLSKEK